MKTHVVRARIEGILKTEAMRVLASHGLDLSDAIRLFLRQVVARGGIPFSIRNQDGSRGARVSKLAQAKIASQDRDRAQLASGKFAAGELFLIRPEDARAAKVEWPACKLSD
jgi:DNA-damage-inducible protein J